MQASQKRLIDVVHKLLYIKLVNRDVVTQAKSTDNMVEIIIPQEQIFTLLCIVHVDCAVLFVLHKAEKTQGREEAQNRHKDIAEHL